LLIDSYFVVRFDWFSNVPREHLHRSDSN